MTDRYSVRHPSLAPARRASGRSDRLPTWLVNAGQDPPLFAGEVALLLARFDSLDASGMSDWSPRAESFFKHLDHYHEFAEG